MHTESVMTPPAPPVPRRSAAFAPVLGLLMTVVVAAQAVRVADPGPRVDAEMLRDDLRTLSADGMEGREFGTAGGARARAYLLRRFTDLGFTATEQPVALAARGNREPRRGANVIAALTGRTDPTRYIVVSAHYDHIGVQRGVVYNGAND